MKNTSSNDRGLLERIVKGRGGGRNFREKQENKAEQCTSIVDRVSQSFSNAYHGDMFVTQEGHELFKGICFMKDVVFTREKNN